MSSLNSFCIILYAFTPCKMQKSAYQCVYCVCCKVTVETHFVLSLVNTQHYTLQLIKESTIPSETFGEYKMSKLNTISSDLFPHSANIVLEGKHSKRWAENSNCCESVRTNYNIISVSSELLPHQVQRLAGGAGDVTELNLILKLRSQKVHTRSMSYKKRCKI